MSIAHLHGLLPEKGGRYEILAPPPRRQEYFLIEEAGPTCKRGLRCEPGKVTPGIENYKEGKEVEGGVGSC